MIISYKLLTSVHSFVNSRAELIVLVFCIFSIRKYISAPVVVVLIH